MASALRLIASTKTDIKKIALMEKANIGSKGQQTRLDINRHGNRQPMEEKLLMELNKTGNIAIVKNDNAILGYGVMLAHRHETEMMGKQYAIVEAALCGNSQEYSESAKNEGAFVLNVLNKNDMRTLVALLLKEIVKAAERNPHIKSLKGVVPGIMIKAAKKAGMGVYSTGNGMPKVKIAFEGKKCTPEQSTIVAAVGDRVVSLPSTDFNKRLIMLGQFLADPRNVPSHLDTPSA